MGRSTTLESRLAEWAREYREGSREHLGGSSSWLASMIRWQGRAPQGLGYESPWTGADEVNEAVLALEKQQKGYEPALVLRVEYLHGGNTRAEKIRKLARLGIKVDSSRFSQHLRLAKVHVAGWLRIPFEELLSDQESISMLEHVVTLDL